LNNELLPSHQPQSSDRYTLKEKNRRELTFQERNQRNQPSIVLLSVPLGHDQRVPLLLARMHLVRIEHDDRLERSVEVREILDDGVGTVLGGGERFESSRVSVKSVRHVGSVRVELLGDGSGVLFGERWVRREGEERVE